MKVYELMSELLKLPSGADVKCSASITTPELERHDTCGKDDFGDDLYSIYLNLDFVSEHDNVIYLNC